MTFSLFKKSLQDKQDIHLIKMSDCRFEKNIPTKIYLNFFHFIRCTNTHTKSVRSMKTIDSLRNAICLYKLISKHFNSINKLWFLKCSMKNETIKYEIAVHIIFLKYIWNDKGRKLCQMMKCLIFFIKTNLTSLSPFTLNSSNFSWHLSSVFMCWNKFEKFCKKIH